MESNEAQMVRNARRECPCPAGKSIGQQEEKSMSIYKFVKWDVELLETLRDSFEFKVHKKVSNGIELTREEKNQLTRELLKNTYSRLGVPLQGWMFDFRDYLRRFWVKDAGGMREVFAPDKTAIRASGRFFSVCKIVEITEGVSK
jgi:hypothetical protein